MNILSWYRDRYTKYIRCDLKSSTIVLSRSLWEKILKDQQEVDKLRGDSEEKTDAEIATGFAVLFTKISNPLILQKEGHANHRPHYAFFINPVWSLHGVSNPKMIQVIPVSKSDDGRVGFQTIQPTVQEIAAVYGIPTAEFGGSDVFDIKVRSYKINGEPYYELQRN